MNEDKESKYLECVHCKRFFACKTKDNKPEQCLNFEERIKDVKSRMDKTV